MIVELHNAFKHILFNEEQHTYKDLRNDKFLISCTTFLKQFEKPFSPYIVYACAKKEGITVDKMREIWKLKADIGKSRGTYIHKYAELLSSQKEYTGPYDNSIIFRLNNDELLDYTSSIDKNIKHVTNYMNDYSHFIPIKLEYVVGNDWLGGMVDKVLLNTKTNKYRVGDYKTDKQFTTESKYKNFYLEPISHLQMCEFNKYSLQLSVYRYIIEEFIPNIDLEPNTVIWFNHNNETYEVIELPYLKKDVEKLFSTRNNS